MAHQLRSTTSSTVTPTLREPAPVGDNARRSADASLAVDPAATLAGAGEPTQAERSAGIENGTRREVYDEAVADLPRVNVDLSGFDWASGRFLQIWRSNEERYRRVGAAAGVPAELVAALHFRESSGNFGTYLHNGQRLGQVTTIVPKGVLFHDWEEAAIDALTRFVSLRDDLQITADTTDPAALATFAEFYNGLGYHNRGLPSPYVYSGTDGYTSGKYVADGVFDPSAVDQQLGVVAMVALARGEAEPGQGVDVALGTRTLQQGHRGTDVAELQRALTAAGFATGVDGDFGPSTRQAVEEAQAHHGLDVDGIVGADTLAALGVTPLSPAAAGPAVAEAAADVGGPMPVPRPDDLGLAPTTAPRPEPRPTPLSRVAGLGEGLLRQGAEGSEVRVLQEALVSLGYRLVVDGLFGGVTAAVVRAFQRSARIGVDGIVGPDTRGALQQRLGG